MLAEQLADGEGGHAHSIDCEEEELGLTIKQLAAIADQAGQMLHDLHPDFVTLVRKTNNNWKGFGNKDRLETRIAWKQAYEAGKKSRAVLR